MACCIREMNKIKKRLGEISNIFINYIYLK